MITTPTSITFGTAASKGIAGTATAAKFFAAALTVSTPATVSDLARLFEPQVRLAQKAGIRTASSMPLSSASTIIEDGELSNDSTRGTTSLENLIGEIRGWSLLKADWDGEGASTPLGQSIKDAALFALLLQNAEIPEPMLLSSGNVALYWNNDTLYADIEFLGNGRIAYFVKKHEDKHKGILSFNSKEMPPVLSSLLQN